MIIKAKKSTVNIMWPINYNLSAWIRGQNEASDIVIFGYSSWDFHRNLNKTVEFCEDIIFRNIVQEIAEHVKICSKNRLYGIAYNRSTWFRVPKAEFTVRHLPVFSSYCHISTHFRFQNCPRFTGFWFPLYTIYRISVPKSDSMYVAWNEKFTQNIW